MTTRNRLPGKKDVGAPRGRARTPHGAVDAFAGDARPIAGDALPFAGEIGARGGGTSAPGGEAGASGGGTGAPSSSPQPRFPQRPPETGPITAPGELRSGGGEGGGEGNRTGTRRERAWPWAVAGLAAGVAGLGAAEAVAVVTGPTSTPLIAAAQEFIDLTPPWLKDFAVRTFGTYDKLALLSGASSVVAVLSALTGVLARRRPVVATLGVLLLGVLGAAAALTRPGATMLSVLPAAAGAVTGMAVLALLRRRGLRPRPDGQLGTARRQLLLASGAAVAGGAVTGVAGRTFNTASAAVEASRAAVQLPPPAARARVLPATVEVGVPGVAPFRVPNADFYRIDTATVVPRLSAADWHLRIHGMVQREVRLGYAALTAGPLVERDVTLICVSNEVGGDLTGNARWLGLPIGPLLKQAGPLPGADMVLSKSIDGWTAGTPLGVLTDGRDALLAVGMNGVPLPIEHGFPVRMVVPGLYGYVSATKWVVDLEVTRFDRAQGYWTPRGWSARGPIKTSSRIDVPKDGASVRAGQVAVAGVAWAQHRGIRGVEVRVDTGPWQRAQLATEASIDTWRQWVYRWNATPGHHTLAVRATDGKGALQTGVPADPEPDGAAGWHTVEVDVV